MGFYRVRKITKKRRDNYGSMGPGVTRENKYKNSPMLVLIFWGIIPCVFCLL